MEESTIKRQRRSKTEVNSSKTTYERLSEKFPERFIKRRLINQGTADEKVIEYIGGDKVIERLNSVIGFNWSFTIEDRIIDIEIGQIAILGRLEAVIDNIKTVKEQWGSSAIDTYSNGKVISLGDNIKAATTDSLKKCATLIGVGIYLYDSESMKFTDKNYVAPSTKETEVKAEEIREAINKAATKAQISSIIKISKENNINVESILKKYGVEKISDMKRSDAANFIVNYSSIVEEISNSSNSSSE